VYVALEGSAGLAPRLAAAKTAAGLDLAVAVGVHFLLAPFSLADRAAVEALLTVVEPLRPVWIIIDPLAHAMAGCDENAAQDMGIIVAACDRIRARTRAALTLAHHTNAAESRERGSSVLRGAVDTLLSLTLIDDRRELSCVKQRDAEAFAPIRLAFTPVPGSGSGVLTLADGVAPAALTTGQARALAVLRTAFGHEGATRAEWLAATPGLPPATFYRAVAALRERGLVSQKGARFRAADPEEKPR
jgi:CRP-like cAMP-binding protein